MGHDYVGGPQFTNEEQYVGFSSPSSKKKIYTMQVNTINNFVVNGIVNKYKDQLVEKCFYKVIAINYNETFEPIIKMN